MDSVNFSSFHISSVILAEQLLDVSLVNNYSWDNGNKVYQFKMISFKNTLFVLSCLIIK